MTANARDQQEPSMEEILSSIRKIIADEEAEEGHSDDDEAGRLEVAPADEIEDNADASACDEEEEEDVLELTKVVRESGEVVDLRASEENDPARPAHNFSPAEEEDEEEPIAEGGDEEPLSAAASDEMADEVELGSVETPVEDITEQDANVEDATAVPKQAAREELLSDAAATVATGAFAKLSHAFQRTPAEESIADGDGRTIEQFVEDMLRPLLREWLDEKLPPIVERLVEKEIHKIARRAELM